jgi:hypothetical protein
LLFFRDLWASISFLAASYMYNSHQSRMRILRETNELVKVSWVSASQRP